MTTDKENRLDGENTQSGRDGYKSYNKEGYNRYNRNEGRSYGRRPYGSNREGGERPYRSSYNPRLTEIMERIVHSAVMESFSAAQLWKQTGIQQQYESSLASFLCAAL